MPCSMLYVNSSNVIGARIDIMLSRRDDHAQSGKSFGLMIPGEPTLFPRSMRQGSGTAIRVEDTGAEKRRLTHSGCDLNSGG